MNTPDTNIAFRILDYILYPLMIFLGGFIFPAQESHPWNVKKWGWSERNGLQIKGMDKKAKFDHSAPFGLYHMPIFGGLTKYVVIEAFGFDKYWYVGWTNNIQSLKIKQNRIKLLTTKKGFTAYGLGDNGKSLKLKIVGYGELGDHKYNGLRLF